MSVVGSAVVPVVLAIALGVGARRIVGQASAWRGLEWLTYYCFTPAMIASAIGAAELRAAAFPPILLALGLPTVVVAAALLSLRAPMRQDAAATGAVLQGSIRFNAYLGLAYSSALHGAAGTAGFAVTAAVMVPVVNALSVGTLAAYQARSGASAIRAVVREVAGNPLILGCLGGVALNLTGGVPSLAEPVFSMLAGPAVVCGAILTGTALQWQLRGPDLVAIAIASSLKLLVLPVIAIIVTLQLDVDTVVRDCLVLVSALPAAPSAYVLAVRLGGDGRLTASITGVQTLLAVITIPCMLALVALT